MGQTISKLSNLANAPAGARSLAAEDFGRKSSPAKRLTNIVVMKDYRI
jgi:hypothetical protein